VKKKTEDFLGIESHLPGILLNAMRIAFLVGKSRRYESFDEWPAIKKWRSDMKNMKKRFKM